MLGALRSRTFGQLEIQSLFWVLSPLAGLNKPGPCCKG